MIKSFTEDYFLQPMHLFFSVFIFFFFSFCSGPSLAPWDVTVSINLKQRMLLMHRLEKSIWKMRWGGLQNHSINVCVCFDKKATPFSYTFCFKPSKPWIWSLSQCTYRYLDVSSTGTNGDVMWWLHHYLVLCYVMDPWTSTFHYFQSFFPLINYFPCFYCFDFQINNFTASN